MELTCLSFNSLKNDLKSRNIQFIASVDSYGTRQINIATEDSHEIMCIEFDKSDVFRRLWIVVSQMKPLLNAMINSSVTNGQYTQIEYYSGNPLVRE